VGFVVDKIALEQVFLQAVVFFPVSFHQCPAPYPKCIKRQSISATAITVNKILNLNEAYQSI
jgi:hypothetical protein